MFVSHEHNIGRNHNIKRGKEPFDSVAQFKNLGTMLTKQHNSMRSWTPNILHTYSTQIPALVHFRMYSSSCLERIVTPITGHG